MSVEWPWQYNFAPFFTLQPNSSTRAKQIAAWRTLVLVHFESNRICKLDTREIAGIAAFDNPAIRRRIDPAILLEVLDALRATGNAARRGKFKWEIYWRTLDEFAGSIYEYVRNANCLNAVMTLRELIEDSGDAVFYKLDVEVLIRALRKLEEENKCVLMLEDGDRGVKFF